jgi:hypothetical protein
MRMTDIPFCTTDWSGLERIKRDGDTGYALYATMHFGELRVRMAEYSPGYAADHWCRKGHVLLCLEGELTTELEDGRVFTLGPGMSYQVADQAEAHRSRTECGARLFIVD